MFAHGQVCAPVFLQVMQSGSSCVGKMLVRLGDDAAEPAELPGVIRSELKLAAPRAPQSAAEATKAEAAAIVANARREQALRKVCC